MFEKNRNKYFSIGGQVNNSSSQSEECLERAIQAIKLFDMNTIAAPLYWYQIEPEEGQFDYEQIDLVLSKAIENDLKVVFLWFGSWKNGASHYVPIWVKKNKKRFLWSLNYAGARTRILSPLGDNTKEADSKAVASVLRYIREKDIQKRMIAFQVENEPGMLGTPRDYSDVSEEMFRKELPEDMDSFLNNLSEGDLYQIWKEMGCPKGGTWQETFGLAADDVFSAYCFAKYIDQVALAGKQEYEIPMYVNVWVRETENRIPGIDYPSGGATSFVLDIWKHFAPHIDCICPDIYFEDRDTYELVCSKYNRKDNPLYIPESHASDMNALHIFPMIEKYGLTGMHCFAIDSTIDNDGKIRPECVAYQHAVKILSSMKPLLEKYHGTGRIYGVAQYECMNSQFIDFGDFWGRVYFLNSITDEAYIHLDNCHDDKEHVSVRGKGLIVYAGNGEFYLAGEGYKLVLIRKDNMEYITSSLRGFKYLNARNQEYFSVEEGQFNEKGQFVVSKVRNGDESDMGLWVCHDIGLVRAVVDCE